MNYQLIAPQSMRDQRHEIVAKVPEGAASGQLKLMIQSMLIDRFKLAVHHETKEMPKYYLTVAKSGPKLEASLEAPPKNDDTPPPPPGSTRPSPSAPTSPSRCWRPAAPPCARARWTWR